MWRLQKVIHQSSYLYLKGIISHSKKNYTSKNMAQQWALKWLLHICQRLHELIRTITSIICTQPPHSIDMKNIYWRHLPCMHGPMGKTLFTHSSTISTHLTPLSNLNVHTQWITSVNFLDTTIHITANQTLISSTNSHFSLLTCYLAHFQHHHINIFHSHSHFARHAVSRVTLARINMHGTITRPILSPHLSILSNMRARRSETS